MNPLGSNSPIHSML